MATQVQLIENFIREVEGRIKSPLNPLLDSNGNRINDFKVLYGRVWANNNLLTLESVYQNSRGMQISFGLDRVCFTRHNIDRNTANYDSVNPILIAILNIEGLANSEKHNLIKTLGHPTQFLNVKGLRGIPNPNDDDPGEIFLEIFDNDNKLRTYFC